MYVLSSLLSSLTTPLTTSCLQAEDLDKMPDRAPCDGEPQGILPQLIASLVARRRTVKGLMKDKSASVAKLMQVRRKLSRHQLHDANTLS